MRENEGEKENKRAGRDTGHVCGGEKKEKKKRKRNETYGCK